MRLLDKVRLRLRSLLRRGNVEREIEAELRFHLDQLIEENIAAGMMPEEARWTALRAIGGITGFQEECRDMRRMNVIDHLLRDVRYAGRSLYRSPGFAIFDTFDRPEGMTIIGVVGDVRQWDPTTVPGPECYMPYSQHEYNNSTLNVVARTAGDPTALAVTMRRVAAEVSADVPVSFTTMETTVSKGMEASRFRALLFGAFAAIAVCLAMAGVYGVMAYAVEQRSKEIGLRMALGASTDSVLRLILKQGLLLASLGLAIGLAGAIAGARLLTSMPFEVQPNDPWVYLAVAVLAGLVTLAASYVPVRRASDVDPLAALRQE